MEIPVLRIWDVYPGSRICFFSIPDQNILTQNFFIYLKVLVQQDGSGWKIGLNR